MSTLSPTVLVLLRLQLFHRLPVPYIRLTPPLPDSHSQALRLSRRPDTLTIIPTQFILLSSHSPHNLKLGLWDFQLFPTYLSARHLLHRQ